MPIHYLYSTIALNLRRSISRWWYEYISTIDTASHMLFMNLGYADPNGTEELELQTVDEKNRYFIQLYHHIAGAIDLRGLNVVEVGSGRGGGASYITRYLEPNSMIGVDLAANAIDFCKQHYAVIKRLSFVRGDAEALEFADNSVDVIVNVESSNCYPNIEDFFQEVVRVLKPGGYFLYTDLRRKEEIEMWREQLRKAGLQLVKEEDITANVINALELSNGYKTRLINKHVPKILHKPFNEFAGMKGTNYFYGAFVNGDKIYMGFVLRKVAK